MLLSAVVGAFAANAIEARAAGFLVSLDDIPTPAELVETPGAALAFEGREGRILLTRASGAATPATVAQFYATALPSLGWARDIDAEQAPGAASALAFIRGRERLVVSIQDQPTGGSEVRYRLVIAPAAPAAD